MSVAYFIVLDKEHPGFETFVNGKAVARTLEQIDAVCDAAGLPKLDGFMGQSLDDLADLLGDDMELPDEGEVETKWFAPQDGIALIDALIVAIRKDTKAVAYTDEVLKDLEEYKGVLAKTAAIGAKWHFSLDI